MAGDVWRISDRVLLGLDRPRVIAILNVTPDSFADGGVLATVDDVVAAAGRAVRDGAAMLDIGGESTRPGAARVPAAEQIARVVPAIRAIRAAGGRSGASAGRDGDGGALREVPISVDTTLAEVARAALNAGADAVNDVSAGLEDPAMLALVAERGAGVVLMHRVREPGLDSYSDRYATAPSGAALPRVREFLAARREAALRAGVREESIVLDPGLGFGKSVEQNVELIRETPTLLGLGSPILSALSRKSFTGRVGLGRDSTPAERLAPTLALSVLHYTRGARLFRVHDVREHVEALRAASVV